MTANDQGQSQEIARLKADLDRYKEKVRYLNKEEVSELEDELHRARTELVYRTDEVEELENVLHLRAQEAEKELEDMRTKVQMLEERRENAEIERKAQLQQFLRKSRVYRAYEEENRELQCKLKLLGDELDHQQRRNRIDPRSLTYFARYALSVPDYHPSQFWGPTLAALSERLQQLGVNNENIYLNFSRVYLEMHRECIYVLQSKVFLEGLKQLSPTLGLRIFRLAKYFYALLSEIHLLHWSPRSIGYTGHPGFRDFLYQKCHQCFLKLDFQLVSPFQPEKADQCLELLKEELKSHERFKPLSLRELEGGLRDALSRLAEANEQRDLLLAQEVDLTNEVQSLQAIVEVRDRNASPSAMPAGPSSWGAMALSLGRMTSLINHIRELHTVIDESEAGRYQDSLDFEASKTELINQANRQADKHQRKVFQLKSTIDDLKTRFDAVKVEKDKFESEVAVLSQHLVEVSENFVKVEESSKMLEKQEILCSRCGIFNSIAHLTSVTNGNCHVCKAIILRIKG